MVNQGSYLNLFGSVLSASFPWLFILHSFHCIIIDEKRHNRWNSFFSSLYLTIVGETLVPIIFFRESPEWTRSFNKIVIHFIVWEISQKLPPFWKRQFNSFCFIVILNCSSMLYLNLTSIKYITKALSIYPNNPFGVSSLIQFICGGLWTCWILQNPPIISKYELQFSNFSCAANLLVYFFSYHPDLLCEYVLSLPIFTLSSAHFIQTSPFHFVVFNFIYQVLASFLKSFSPDFIIKNWKCDLPALPDFKLSPVTFISLTIFLIECFFAMIKATFLLFVRIISSFIGSLPPVRSIERFLLQYANSAVDGKTGKKVMLAPRRRSLLQNSENVFVPLIANGIGILCTLLCVVFSNINRHLENKKRAERASEKKRANSSITSAGLNDQQLYSQTQTYPSTSRNAQFRLSQGTSVLSAESPSASSSLIPPSSKLGLSRIMNSPGILSREKKLKQKLSSLVARAPVAKPKRKKDIQKSEKKKQ